MQLLAVCPSGELLATAAMTGPALLWRSSDMALLGEVFMPLSATAGNGAELDDPLSPMRTQPMSNSVVVATHTSAAMSARDAGCTALLWLRCGREHMQVSWLHALTCRGH